MHTIAHCLSVSFKTPARERIVRFSTRPARISLVALTVLVGCAESIHAAVISWNAGDGSWNNAANWSPNVVPGLDDDVRIGNLPGVQDSTVSIVGGDAGFESVEITDGMTLDLNNTEFVTFGDVSVLGANSRIIARPTLGPNFHDLQGILHVGAGAHLQLVDNVPVRIFTGSESAGTISGRGDIQVSSSSPFRNDGIIDPGGNGGIILTQIAPFDIDLDGLSGNGQLLLITPFDELEVNASGLSDSFSGTVSLAPGALLTMNMTEGWTTSASGSINVGGTNNPNATSLIAGSELTLGGMLNVGGAQGHLRILAPVTVAANGVVNIGDTDWLEFDGATTVLGGQFDLSQGARLDFDGPATLEDGQFTLDQDADLVFDGATTVLGGQFGMGEGAGLGFSGDTIIRGGVFTTASNSIEDGLVLFSGPTEWDGNVTINGVARQVADAVVTGATVINAGLLDMDGGDGDTAWTIQASTVINAARIDSSEPREFNGTLNIGAGFLGQLTINIDDPAPQWTMAGEMNLNGVAAAAFFLNRVGGSHLRMSGDLNVAHRVRITSDATFGDGSVTSFADSTSALQMTGQTLIAAGAAFNGQGMLDNGATGTMTLADGAALGQVGLVNRGLLEVGDSPGVAAVDHFENADDGTWLVEIGGYVAGTEHDLLLVTGGTTDLDGLIEVDLIDLIDDVAGPFLPQVGDEFMVLTSLGAVSGTFLNNPVSSAAGQQFHWSVIYNPNDVTLRLASITVPEPASLLLLTLGAMVQFRCRKRIVKSRR